MIIKLLILAILGAFIGWITNLVAIKMLFKPVNPVKIGFFELQGVFPKRQAAVAKSLGKVVESELIGLDDFKSSLLTDDNIKSVKDKLKIKLEQVIKDNIPPIFLSMAGDSVSKIIENFINSNDNFFTDIFDDLLGSKDSINISKIVEEKVNKMDFSSFETILLQLIDKELKFIEYIGGVLGFIIGLIQGVIVNVL